MLAFRVRASPPYASAIGLRWSSQRVTGNVEKWFPAKGYGFLKDELGHSYFVHRRYLKTLAGGIPGLRPGQSVSFTRVAKSDGRFHGEEVTLPDGALLPSVPHQSNPKVPSTQPAAAAAPAPPGSAGSVTPHQAGDAPLTPPPQPAAAAAPAPPGGRLNGSINACQREARLRLRALLRQQANELNDSFIAARALSKEAETAARVALDLFADAKKSYEDAQSRSSSSEELASLLSERHATQSNAIACTLRFETAKLNRTAAETAALRSRTRWEAAISISIEAWRPELAAYHGWPLVGELESAVKCAESILQSLEKVAGNKNVKLLEASSNAGSLKRARDSLPFYYVMNPPRHGKSLFLDLLFRSHPNVVVAPVSYNAVDPMRVWEMASPEAWWCGFQARVAWSLLGGSFETRGDEWAEFDIRTSDWPKNLIIVIDEFSKVTDHFVDKPRRNSIYEKMWGVMCQTQGRIYMTGFNAGPFRQAVASTFSVLVTALPQCEPSEVENLGLILYHAHGEALFPHFIYELCKSTPGLLGTLVELVVEHKVWIPDDLKARPLGGAISWVSFLERDAAKYWPIIVRVMKGDAAARTEAESHELTVLRYGQPALSPFAVAVIVTSLKHDGVADKELLASLQECVNICKQRQSEESRPVKALPPELSWVRSLHQEIAAKFPVTTPNGATSGKTLEIFTAHAMHARLLCGGTLLPRCDVVVRARAPAGSSTLRHVDIHVHILADRASLEELLGEVPYALFPCGYELLGRRLSRKEMRRDGVSKEEGTQIFPGGEELLGVESSDAEARPDVLNQKKKKEKKKRFKAVTAVTPQDDTAHAPARYHAAEAVDRERLTFFPGVLQKTPMPVLHSPPNAPRVDENSRQKPSHQKPSHQKQSKQNPAKVLMDALQVADYMIRQVERCWKDRVSVIAVPKQRDNAYCDVVAILAREDGCIDIAMVECRDRREMRVDDYREKVSNLVAARTLIHDLDSYFAKGQLQGKVRWHHVLAGRCDKSPSAAEVVEALRHQPPPDDAVPGPAPSLKEE